MDSTVLCLLSKGGKIWIMKNCMELVVSTKVAAVGAMRFMAPFRSEKEADSWLHTQENDFRERSLVSKSAAIKLAGQRAFGLSKINLDYFVNEVLKK